MLGYALSVGGAALGIVGMMTRSFPLLLVGMALFGIAQTSNLLARYAAADVSPGPQRGRAMGLIVWGSAVGSLVGPNLMEPAVRAGAHLDLSPAASAFLISLAGYWLAAILVEIFLRPDRSRSRVVRRTWAAAGPPSVRGRSAGSWEICAYSSRWRRSRSASSS